jgi:hypothetical protein
MLIREGEQAQGHKPLERHRGTQEERNGRQGGRGGRQGDEEERLLPR